MTKYKFKKLKKEYPLLVTIFAKECKVELKRRLILIDHFNRVGYDNKDCKTCTFGQFTYCEFYKLCGKGHEDLIYL